MEDLTKMVDEKLPIDVIYLDFSKAFDSVPHARLLSKLNSYGIVGKVHTWIEGFLTGREQRVRVGDKSLDTASVTSGIPQGSVLSPILFILYINDLPDCVQSYCKIFADDTKV